MIKRFPPQVESELNASFAAAQAMVFAYCLWALTWMQFVTKLWYGLPLYKHPHRALVFYERIAGYPFSVAELFLLTSIAATLLAIVGVWLTSRAGSAKWRQRFLVLVFGTICCGFAIASFPWEDVHLQDARRLRQFLIQDLIPEEGENPARGWEHLDRAIEKAEVRRTR